MSRRPRRNRPPKLDLPPPRQPATARQADRVRTRGSDPLRGLVRARLAGVPSRVGRSELTALVAAVVAGNPRATLGLDLTTWPRTGPGRRPTRDEVWSALGEVWGCDAASGAVSVDASRTLAAARVAAARIAAVGAAGGTVALATSRPASLLACYQALARRLEAAGASVVRSSAARSAGRARPSAAPTIWWVGGVGVAVADGSIRAIDDPALADDWRFGVGRPDLVVADGVFAAAAIGAGHPTVALADLDVPALGIAALRGAPVLLVPVDCARPPEAYAPLVELLGSHLEPGRVEAGAPPVDGGPTAEPPSLGSGAAPQERAPHSTTPAPGAYAAPESGGEG